jgi:hypothetical protein
MVKKMKSKSLIIFGLVLVISLILIIFVMLQPTPIWKVNAEAFVDPFLVISGDIATIDDLSEFTTFDWDTLVSFAPYTSEERIYEVVVGYKWDKICSTVSEGMNQIVFLKDGKVVCYLDGHPDKYKVFFSFGQYDGDYIKLASSDKLSFQMIVTDNGYREFNFIPKGAKNVARNRL